MIALRAAGQQQRRGVPRRSISWAIGVSRAVATGEKPLANAYNGRDE